MNDRRDARLSAKDRDRVFHQKITLPIYKMHFPSQETRKLSYETINLKRSYIVLLKRCDI